MYPNLYIFGIELPIYFVALSLIFSVTSFIILKRSRALGLDSVFALDLYLYVLVGAFVGARLFYVLYQEPHFFLENPFEVLRFWNGGYVFFGGLIGAFVAGYFYAKKKSEPISLWLNFSLPILSFGYIWGRFTCLLSGCCYGEKTLSWFAVFLHGAYRHPAQVYAAFYEAVLLCVLIFIEKKKGFNQYPVYALWFIGHGAGRIFMELFRADPRGGFILGLSVSTWISLALVLLGLTVLSKARLKRLLS